MSYYLLLSSAAYPNAFENIEIESLDYSKQIYVENKILEVIKEKNKKFDIDGIEYCRISERFPNFQETNYSGAIVEVFNITEREKESYYSDENYIFEKEGNIFVQQLWAYMFLSVPREQSRSSLISQSIFPPLIDFMNIYRDSPSYTIANHPIYFLNIINKNITAASIIRKLAGLIAMDIVYIEVFTTTLNTNEIPKDPKAFLHKFNDCSYDDNSFQNNCFYIDFENKIFRIKTEDLIVGKYLILKDNGNIDFHGSDEKFYWMDLLPMLMLSLKYNYEIDYSDLELFVTSKRDLFSNSNKKIERFEILLNYIIKLIRGVENV